MDRTRSPETPHAAVPPIVTGTSVKAVWNVLAIDGAHTVRSQRGRQRQSTTLKATLLFP